MTNDRRAGAAPLSGLVQPLVRLSTTRVNLQLGLGCDWLIAIALGAGALRHGGLRPGPAALTVSGGLIAFSFIEYAAHRWLFHGPIGPFRAGHARHHADPHGYDALPFFLPPLFIGALAGGFVLALAVPYALLLAGAVALGYAVYGSAHVVLHAHRFRQPWLRRWQRFHDLHHRHPAANFGVTTGLWDAILGTRWRAASHAPRPRR